METKNRWVRPELSVLGRGDEQVTILQSCKSCCADPVRIIGLNDKESGCRQATLTGACGSACVDFSAS